MKNYLITKFLIITITIACFITCALVVLTNAYTPIGISKSTSVMISFAGIAIILLPLVFEWLLKLNYTLISWAIFSIFILLCMALGSSLGIYNIVPFFDTILHFSSGVIIAFFSYAIFSKYITAKSYAIKIFYIFLFAWCFAMFVGAAWEIWEFSMDHIFGYNAQRYADELNNNLIGHAALIDTMQDIICDFMGGFVASGALSVYYLVKKCEIKDLLTFKQPSKKLDIVDEVSVTTNTAYMEASAEADVKGPNKAKNSGKTINQNKSSNKDN